MIEERTISLTTPGDPSSVSIVRSVAANVAARFDVPYDAVDDLRIAVAEACNRVLHAVPAAEELRLDLRTEPHALTASVSVELPGAGGALPERENSLEWTIIEGLTDRSDEVVADGRLTIVMELRTDVHTR